MPCSLPSVEVARHWLDRWDRQQEFYLADREERFVVVGDVVAAACGRPDPLVVDLGSGPGSTSVRVLDRFPDATVVAVDADPLLLGLARAAYGDRRRLRFVDHDLRDAGWADALGLDRRPDAVVSTTALHWLTREELGRVYDACGRLLGPGGVLVDGDHFADGPTAPGLTALTERIGAERARRVGLGRTEDWADWWASVDAAPELAELTAGRDVRPIDHSVPEPPSLADHVQLLLAAGFTEAGTVWQHGDDRVLVALR